MGCPGVTKGWARAYFQRIQGESRSPQALPSPRSMMIQHGENLGRSGDARCWVKLLSKIPRRSVAEGTRDEEAWLQ